MDSKKSLNFWNEFVNRDIYRVTSDEYIDDIVQNGLDPANDPFQGMFGDINKLFELMVGLEERGIVYEEIWKPGPVTASHIIEFNRASRVNNYIDFVADYQQALKFDREWKGGALTSIIFNFTSFLRDQELSDKDKELVDKLHEWSADKRNYGNRILVVKGSSTIFENAEMLCFPGNRMQHVLPSPYGSFEHFERIIGEKWDQYSPFLKMDKLSYLRVTERIPADVIRLIG